VEKLIEVGKTAAEQAEKVEHLTESLGASAKAV